MSNTILIPHFTLNTLHLPFEIEFWQGGDVTDGSGKGDPHFSIADETFAVKHDDVGILGMANNGPDAPHSAATQVQCFIGDAT